MLWKISLVLLGAFAATQAAVQGILGNVPWVTLVYAGLGVATAAVAATDATFKPGQRSVGWATLSRKFDQEIVSIELEIAKFSELGGEERSVDFCLLAERLEEKFAILEKERADLYVVGPIGRLTRKRSIRRPVK